MDFVLFRKSEKRGYNHARPIEICQQNHTMRLFPARFSQSHPTSGKARKLSLRFPRSKNQPETSLDTGMVKYCKLPSNLLMNNNPDTCMLLPFHYLLIVTPSTTINPISPTKAPVQNTESSVCVIPPEDPDMIVVPPPVQFTVSVEVWFVPESPAVST